MTDVSSRQIQSSPPLPAKRSLGSLRGAFSSLGRRTILGLSVEGDDLRLICVSGREIVRLVNRPLGPDLMPGGMVVDPPAFGDAIQQSLADYDFPRGTVVAGFPDVDARSRLLTLPKSSAVKIDEVVDREVRRDPLMSQQGLRIFHQVVAERSIDFTVFILAVRADALRNFVQGLRLAGLPPNHVDLRPLAMIRAINQPHAFIVNVERTSLDVVIVSNNIPVIMRSVPLADGADGGDPTAPPTAIQATFVDEVTGELERTIASYNNDHLTPLSPRLPLALTGDLSSDHDLRQAVQERLGHPLASLTCPFSGPPGFDIANFIVSIGLVLKVK